MYRGFGRSGSEHSEGAKHSFTIFLPSVSQLCRVVVVRIVVRIPCCLVEKKLFLNCLGPEIFPLLRLKYDLPNDDS